ncbi:MAG: glycosyltransferase family 4 protein [Panacagrimonas sp.]
MQSREPDAVIGEQSIPGKRIRLAHLVSHPIQYYAPLYRALSTFEDIDLTVFYFSDMGLEGYFDKDFDKQIRWDVDLTGGYRAVFVPSARGKVVKAGFAQKPNWDLLSRLVKGKYDVIWAHGYQYSNVLLAKLISLLRAQAFLVREDQTLLEARSLRVRAIKGLVFRFFFSGAKAGALYTGVLSRAHFKYFGVRESRLFPAVHCVDDALFSSEAEKLRPTRREIRQKWGVQDDAPIVLFCGKLIDKKQPLRLIDAFARALAKRPCWLLMVGDGPLMSRVTEACKRLNIADRVIFTGFLNQHEMPRAYTAADIFVLPSSAHETWGLVVNEAMHFSLPVIVSDHVGCAPDLVHDGENGYVFPAMDTEGLIQALDRLIADADRRLAFGLQSAALIRQYTVNHCARQIRQACFDLSRA